MIVNISKKRYYDSRYVWRFFMMDVNQRIKELEKENEYLKQELKKRGYVFIDKRRTLTASEKIDIFMDYFKGRNDIYAKRYYRTKKQIYGWCPACTNEFGKGCAKVKGKADCANCNVAHFKKLTRDIVKNHFNGKENNMGIGLYPLNLDNSCYLIALDFDENDWFEDMHSVYKIAMKYGIHPLMERSASGLGGHLWIFFEEAISAMKARNLMMLFIQEAMEVNKQLKFDSFDRMFPNQDRMPQGSFGNLIALPLRYDAYIKGNSAFINEYQQVIEQPIEYLMTIPKVNETLVDTILSNQSKEDYFFDKMQIGFNFNLETAYTKRIDMIENTMLCIEKKTLNTYTLNVLKRLASMYNPEYRSLQNMKKTIYRGSTPRVLCYFEEDDQNLYLPRGIKQKIHEVFPEAIINVDDQTSCGKSIEIAFKKTLRKNQIEPVNKLMKYEMGVMKAVTGFGKTVMAIYIMSQIKLNTLVIVPTKELQNQWVERIDEFLTYPKTKLKKDRFICVYNGTKKRLNGNIDIATVASLAKIENSKEILSNYGLVIIDECHHAASNTFISVLRNLSAKYVYSFSATPERTDGLEKVVYMFCGPLRYITNSYEIQANYTFKQILIPRMTTMRILDHDLEYNGILDELMRNQARNYLILKDVAKEYKENGKIILLTERVEHVSILYEMMRYLGEHVYALSGAIKDKERAEIIKKVRNLSNNENYILIATSKLLGEGFDMASLKTLFLVMPVSAENRIIQYTGRIHRNYEGKDIVKVYDYVDVNIPMMEAMFQKRLKQYQREGYYLQEDDDETIEMSQMVYDCNDYEQSFISDIENAKKEIVIMNVKYEVSKIKKYFLLLQEKVHQNIKIYFMVDIQNHNEEIINHLEGLGGKMINCKHHKHFIVIDRKIVWYSNFDFFGRNSSQGYSTRFMDEMFAEEVLSMISEESQRNKETYYGR